MAYKDPLKQKEYYRKYYKNNREKYLEREAKRYDFCPDCGKRKSFRAKHCQSCMSKYMFGLEHRSKIAESKTGLTLSPETRKKISEIKKILYKETKSPFYGKLHTEQSKRKMSQALQGRISSFQGHSHSNEAKHILSIKAKERHKRIGHPCLGKKLSEETKAKIRYKRQFQKMKPLTEEQKSNLLRGLFKRPTSLETIFQDIIDRHKLPYRYTGNGDFWIGRKNPDFVNINGQKVCVEVANHYHHPDPWKKNRVEHFEKWGWKCIVFFEDEFDESKILEVLNDLD